MAIKLTYEEVKKYIESFECELLSEEYIGCDDKLKIKCRCGKIFYKRFNNFKNENKQCPLCSKMKTPYSYNEIKKYIESYNCKLLSEIYTNNKTPLKIQCKCGEVFYRTFNDFKENKNKQCTICSKTKKPTYDEVKEYIEKCDCKLLSKIYKSGKSPLKIQCIICGQIFYRCLNVFKKIKNQCKNCSEVKKIKYENIKKYIENNNCELLSKTYKNSNTLLKIQCKCGKIFYRSLNSFKSSKKQCLICSNKEKLNYEQVKNYIESFGCKLLSESYKNVTEKLKIQCKCGEIFYRNLAGFRKKEKNVQNVLTLNCFIVKLKAI